MVKHQIQLTVKYGEFASFMDAVHEWQKKAAELGIEQYSIWVNNRAGKMNEVFMEAEFESHEALQERDSAEDRHVETFGEVMPRMLSHVVAGSAIDRRIDRCNSAE